MTMGSTNDVIYMLDEQNDPSLALNVNWISFQASKRETNQSFMRISTIKLLRMQQWRSGAQWISRKHVYRFTFFVTNINSKYVDLPTSISLSRGRSIQCCKSSQRCQQPLILNNKFLIFKEVIYRSHFYSNITVIFWRTLIHHECTQYRFLAVLLLHIKKLISTNKLFMTYAVVVLIKRLNYIIIYWIINIKPIDPGK